MRSRSARRSTTGARLASPSLPSVSRQASPVSDSLIPALAAVWLTWKSSGRLTSWPCGASSAVHRSGPPRDWPTDSSAMRAEPAPANASTPRREIVGCGGRHGGQVPGVRRLRAGAGEVRAQLPPEAAAAQRPDHGRQLERHVDDEARDEHPGAVEVQRVEGTGELVPRLDVQDPGRELEHRPADEQEQRQPFQGVRGRAQRRPLEQLRQHRPQLEQQDRHQHQPQGDVDALVEPVEPDRMGGPGEQVEAEQPLAWSHVVDRAEVRVVGGVGQQAGREHHRDGRQQHQAEHRGQPRAADRAAPERPAERPRRRAGGDEGFHGRLSLAVPSRMLTAVAQEPPPRGSHTYIGRTLAPATGRNRAAGTPASSGCGHW